MGLVVIYSKLCPQFPLHNRTSVKSWKKSVNTECGRSELERNDIWVTGRKQGVMSQRNPVQRLSDCPLAFAFHWVSLKYRAQNLDPTYPPMSYMTILDVMTKNKSWIINKIYQIIYLRRCLSATCLGQRKDYSSRIRVVD